MLSLKKEPKTYVEQGNYDTLKAAYSNGHDGHVYDIGNYTNGRMETLTDQEKLSLIENVWKPSCDYKFPVTIMGRRSGSCKFWDGLTNIMVYVIHHLKMLCFAYLACCSLFQRNSILVN